MFDCPVKILGDRSQETEEERRDEEYEGAPLRRQE
jgi:hypothetical protein